MAFQRDIIKEFALITINKNVESCFKKLFLAFLGLNFTLSPVSLRRRSVENKPFSGKPAAFFVSIGR